MRWNALGAWSGHRGRQTESFDITTGSLRLTWDARRDQVPLDRDSAYLRVSLHSAISGRVLETVTDTRGPGAGTIRLAAQPRVAYLLVESGGLEWSVTLEEGLPVSAD